MFLRTSKSSYSNPVHRGCSYLRYRRSVPPPQRAQCAPAPTSIIGWWTADEHADDIIGGHHGSWDDPADELYVTGVVDMAFNFGFDSHITIADDDELDFGPTRSMSIVLWAYLRLIDEQLVPFYGKPVAKFLTISIQNANLTRAEARTVIRVINCLLLT
jgi:hypothetical protein